MRNYLRLGAAVLSRASRLRLERAVSRQTARHVRAAQVNVVLRPAHAGVLVRATYVLGAGRQGSTDRRPLVVVHGSGELQLQRLEGIVSSPRNPDVSWRGVTAFDLRLPRDVSTWSGQHFTAELFWPTKAPGSASSLLLLPAMLPQLITRDPPVRFALPRVSIVNHVTRMAICTVGVVEPERTALSGVVTESEAYKEDGRIRLTQRLLQETEDPARLCDRIARILDALSMILGPPPNVDAVCLMTRAEFGAHPVGGPAVGLGPGDLASLAGGANTAMIASRLASMWWGSAARIHGRWGRELEFGACMGVGLRVGDVLVDASNSRALDRVRAMAARPRYADWSHRLKGFTEMGRCSRFALGALTLASEDPAKLYAVTQRALGWSMPVSEVAPELGIAVND